MYTYRDRLRDLVHPLAGQIDPDDCSHHLASFLAGYEEFFPAALEEYGLGARELAKRQPAYESKIGQYDAILASTPVPVETVWLFGSADEETVRSTWREQLAYLAGTLHVILVDDGEKLRA